MLLKKQITWNSSFQKKKKKELGKNIFNLRLSWRKAEILLPA
jgi:hypothetical protein